MLELDAWLSYCELNRGLSPRTCSNYRLILMGFGNWLRDVRRIASPAVATGDLLQEYCGAVLHERGQAPASRRVAVSAVRGYFDWLVRKGEMRANPAEGLPSPRLGRKLPLPIGLADAEKLIAAPDLETFKGVRDVAIMAVLLGCGPRVSGVVDMNEGDLIFGRDDKGIEDLTLRLREKGQKERYVPAPEETRLLLRAYLGHPELQEIDRLLPNGDEVLFVNLSNSGVPAHDRRGEARRIGKWSLWKMLQGYGEECGIPKRFLHPHAFRHLYGKELAEGDEDILVRQKLMGHSDSSHTEIYSHIADRKLRKAAERSNPLRRIKTPATGLAGILKGR